MAAQIIKQWIGLNDEKIVRVMRLISALQLVKGAFFLSQAKIEPAPDAYGAT